MLAIMPCMFWCMPCMSMPCMFCICPPACAAVRHSSGRLSADMAIWPPEGCCIWLCWAEAPHAVTEASAVARAIIRMVILFPFGCRWGLGSHLAAALGAATALVDTLLHVANLLTGPGAFLANLGAFAAGVLVMRRVHQHEV